LYSSSQDTATSFSRRAPQDSNGTTSIPDLAYDENAAPNKGPLLTIALALFGPGSFIADRVTHPEAYIDSGQFTALGKCINRMPFTGLVLDRDNLTGEQFDQCISDSEWNFGQLQMDLVDYVQLFIASTSPYAMDGQRDTYDQLLDNAFEAAAFLANEQWLTKAFSPNLNVNYDKGTSIQIPHISTTGIYLVSILLSIYLVALLAMTIYSILSPRWAKQLDSLVMMQYGAAIADHLPFNIVANSQKMNVLDDTPGWLGDANGSASGVGQLGLGALTPLQARRRYRCFEHDHELTATSGARA
jgi:hypothetical protein